MSDIAKTDIGSWKPFLLYFIFIAIPFLGYHFYRLQKDQKWKRNILREIQTTILKYHIKFSGLITIYHLILTSVLALYFIQSIFQNLKIAVDLSYYTKTSIKTYQAYDAIQSGEYDYSYYNVKNYQYTTTRPGLETETASGTGTRRRLDSSYDDLVVVYHTGSWKNVLTSDLLIDICLTEMNVLSELTKCVGSDESSMIQLIFTPDCQYRTSYEESLYLFGLEENSPYVENNVNPNDPISHVLISYFSVTCSLSLSDVNSAVDASTVGHIHINYAQTDLIIEAFLSSGLHDIKLSVVAVIICYVILSISLHFNFFFAGITILCILLALVIAVGLLPAYGYDYLSAFNVLAIFVITGVGSDAILIFISSWHKYFKADLSKRIGFTMDSSPDLETILLKSYGSTAPALLFTVSTTVLSFMSNLVSPIIVVSQLGAFMGSSMMLYFIFLHLIAIPCWISVVRLKKNLTFYLKRHHQARWGAGIEHSTTMLIENRSPEWTGKEYENTPIDMCLMGCFTCLLWCMGEKDLEVGDGEPMSPTTRLSNIFVGITPGGFSDDDKNNDCSIDATAFSFESNPPQNFPSAPPIPGSPRSFESSPDENDEVVTVSDSTAPDTVRLSTKKVIPRQSIWLGCGGLVAVIVGLFGFLFLMFSIVQTDWGLPLIFPKKDNISGLMYVAIHYKPDILSLSSDGESSNPPIVVHEPTASPTSSPSGFATSNPTHSPTFLLTRSPTISPTSSPTKSFITNQPTLQPTTISNVPTLSPTHSPTDMPAGDSVDYTDYTVDICYGLGIKTHSIDSDATAKFDASSFAKYAETSFLSDAQVFCEYLSTNRKKMELQTPDNECLYNSLMAVSSENISIYDRVFLWMNEDRNRYRYVGAELPDNSTQGNFGKQKTLLLTWICQPLDCRANISSFFDDPNHAIKMIDRWDHALYDKGDPGASSMSVSTLTSSDAWLFPVLSQSLVTALIQSSLISFLGCLSLLLLTTKNLKLVFLIGLSMFLIIVLSLTAHALSFSNTINLIDVVVLISFIGIIIDYPTHMAFHYQHDITQTTDRNSDMTNGSGSAHTSTGADAHHQKHKNSFTYMRFSLVGPAFTTICSAVPLLFAEFTLISKAGEYVVILTLVTYVFVALIMPTLLRFEYESVLIPTTLSSKIGKIFTS
jgi:hypothetical protein